MPKIKFTKSAVAKLPLPKKPAQTDYFERLNRGLSLVLSLSYAGARTWSVVYCDAESRPRRKKLGNFTNSCPA